MEQALTTAGWSQMGLGFYSLAFSAFSPWLAPWVGLPSFDLLSLLEDEENQ